jgi:hypothetical protein
VGKKKSVDSQITSDSVVLMLIFSSFFSFFFTPDADVDLSESARWSRWVELEPSRILVSWSVWFVRARVVLGRLDLRCGW